MQKYNKAWAAGLAAALVQIVASFVDLSPELSGALVAVVTAAIVALAPANKVTYPDPLRGS